MYFFGFLVLFVSTCLVQDATSQYIGSGWPSGLGLNPHSPQAHSSPSGCGPYGGVGSGDVDVTGDLPVSGQTMITGNVPVLGTVSFTGQVPAGGTVSINGNCGCPCNNNYLH